MALGTPYKLRTDGRLARWAAAMHKRQATKLAPPPQTFGREKGTMSYCECVHSHDGVLKMGWVLFEVFLAFGLAIFIVWWTFPKSKKTDDSASKKDGE